MRIPHGVPRGRKVMLCDHVFLCPGKICVFSAVFNRKWRLFVEAPGRPPPAGGENVEFRADLLHICREHGMMDSIKEGVDRYDRLRYRESRAEQSRAE